MTAELVTDDHAIDAWLTWLERSRGRSARTIESYRLALTRLREYLADDGVALLDAQQVQLEMFTGLWLHKKGVIARSRIPYISAIRGFYAFVADRGWTRLNQADKLEHPKTGKPLPRAISLSNAERLMWAPDMSTFKGVRDALLMSVMIGCALRVSGVIGLNESSLLSVQIDGRPRVMVRTLEKGNKERLVPMPKEAEMLLRVYLGHEDLAEIDRNITRKGHPDKVLFVSVRSTRLRPHLEPGDQRRLTRKAVNEMIKYYGRRLDIPEEQLHPHAMRHLFGVEMAEDDVPTASTSDLMGHSDPKASAIYTTLAMRKKTALIDEHNPLAKMRTPVSELLKRLPK